jgi:hypothetical protein
MRRIFVALIVVFSFLMVIPQALFCQGPGWFKPYISLHPGSKVEAVALGDVNGDGLNDVVVATGIAAPDVTTQYKLLVYLQDDSGKLAGYILYDLVTFTHGSVDIGDLDNDGRNDVVISTNRGISVYYQNAAGGLKVPVEFPSSSSTRLRVADLNHDALADVVSLSGQEIQVFLQKDGTLAPPATYPVAIGNLVGLEVGDLDGDGFNDIVVGDFGGPLATGIDILYQAPGSPGTFSNLTSYAGYENPVGYAVGDLNNDGLTDLLVASPNAAVVYRNPAGTPDAPPASYALFDRCNSPVLLGDINRDSRLDALVIGETSMTVLSQQEDGTLASSESYPLPYATRLNPQGAAIGDIDNDGREDVVYAGSDSGLVILYGQMAGESITVQNPVAGSYNVGGTVEIQWTSVGSIDEVNIAYSIDGGSHWIAIVNNTDNDGSYSWVLPYTPSTNCLVRVTYSGGSVFDDSATFSIVDDGVARIFVTSPNGGENLVVGTSYDITWITTGTVGDVKIEYSIDSGSTWTTIIAGTTNNGTYAWTVPNAVTSECLVRISEATDNDPTDTSDATFSILASGSKSITVTSPNGGESLAGGSPYTITWTSSGTIAQVVLEFSSNSGGTWTEIAIATNNGSYSWTVPSINSTRCLIRIKNLSGGTPVDQSNSAFTINYYGAAFLTVQQPNGGESYCGGQTNKIAWTFSGVTGNVKLQYSVNNGGAWTTIVSSTPNDGSYFWTVPSTISDQCLVKISDAAAGTPADTSNAVFTIDDCGETISLTSPTGGEAWQVGSVHNITWVSGASVSSQVKLQYSVNNQATWNTIISSTPNDGSYAWTIPNAPSTTCNIRISDAADAGIYNISYGIFSIVVGIEDPKISLNRTALYFGSLRNNTAKTGIQDISVTNGGSGTLKWTAAIYDPAPGDGDNLDWLRIINTSGTQAGKVEVYVIPSQLAAGTYTGAVRFTSTNASNSPQTVNVTLKVYPTLGDSPPFGSYETPIHGSTVMSSIPVTGWALDDIGIDKVTIWREEGGDRIYIGEAVLVEGARPDVEQSYPTYPMSYRAGWGYMLLTNMLPNGGNGTFKLSAYVKDLAGHEVKLGSKTITCDNAHAVKPFGAMDSPVQGGEASGRMFKNRGWVLTPMPNKIPENGSTIKVYVDGQYLGHPAYNAYRADIATLFPGYANSNGAFAYFNLDTTVFENGVHTIQWTATDNAGHNDGIGSRYFTIQNSGYNRQAGAAQSPGNTTPGTRDRYRPADLLNLPEDPEVAVNVRYGYREEIKPERIKAGQDGIIHITIPQDERLVLDLNQPRALRHTGYLAVNGQLRPLPPGASLDNRGGIFYWQPGPASLGKYSLEFISESETGTTKRIVTVEIIPKLAE